jgi:hypothetical protein
MRPILLSAFLLLGACDGRVLDVGSGPHQSGGPSAGGGPSLSQGGSGGGGPQVGILGGAGYFTVTSDVPTAGAATGSYAASVVFTSGFVDPNYLKTVGACVINPTYIEPQNDHSGIVGAPRPQAGEVHIDGGNLSLIFDTDAAGDYAPQKATGPVAWKGGEAITIAWLGNGASQGLESGLSHSFRAPTYASLDPGSAFAEATPTISRLNDLELAWHFDASPGADDRVVVDLRVSPAYNHSARALCAFDASAGHGVVSANALETIGAGSGTYSVTSEHDFAVVTNYWHLNYTLAARARGTDGLATGSVTIE